MCMGSSSHSLFAWLLLSSLSKYTEPDQRKMMRLYQFTEALPLDLTPLTHSSLHCFNLSKWDASEHVVRFMPSPGDVSWPVKMQNHQEFRKYWSKIRFPGGLLQNCRKSVDSKFYLPVPHFFFSLCPWCRRFDFSIYLLLKIEKLKFIWFWFWFYGQSRWC